MAEREPSEFDQYTESYLKDHQGELQAVHERYIALVRMGKDEWNKWADQFKRYMEEKGDRGAPIIFPERQNVPISEFKGYCFPMRVDFSYASFPVAANFDKAVFNSGVNFYRTKFNLDVSFHKTRFEGRANFSNTRFMDGAYFIGSRFISAADFVEASFAKIANFDEACFIGTVDFSTASIKETANFNGVTFHDNVIFIKVRFEASAYFFGSTFASYTSFYNAIFQGETYFYKATFDGHANFQSCLWAQFINFNEVKFTNKVPDFRHSTYKSTPYLSSVSIPNLGNESRDNVQHYRKLKEMAIAAHDHQKEIEFFAYETIAARGAEDKGVRQLPGYIYQVFSNFGQSLIRPLLWLCLITLGCFYLYIGPLNDGHPTELPEDLNCYVETNERFVDQRIQYFFRYTLASSLPLTLSTRQEKNQVTRCLFGSAVVPWRYKLVGIFQAGMTYLYLFLFGLAVRNRFKIRS